MRQQAARRQFVRATDRFHPVRKTALGRLPTVVVLLGAMLGGLTVSTVQGQQAPDGPVVPDAVHRAAAGHPDGRAFVLVLLDHAGVVRDDLVLRMAEVLDRQRDVLDTLEADELELVLLPDDVGAFTARITASGVAKLSTHPLVLGVGLDALDYLYQIPFPTQDDIQALEGTSEFVITEVVPRMVPGWLELESALVPRRDPRDGPAVLAAGSGQSFCAILEANGANAINWQVNTEPSSGAQAQNETSIAASPVTAQLLFSAWNDGTLQSPSACTLFQIHTVRHAVSTDDGSTWATGNLNDMNMVLRTMTGDPGTAIGGNGDLYLGMLTFDNNFGDVVFTSSTNQGQSFSPLHVIPGSNGSGTDKPLISADPDSTRGSRVYVHWTDTNGNIQFSRSTQAGAAGTFLATPVQLFTNPGPDNALASVSTVGPAGELYVAWIHLGSGASEGDEVIHLRRAADAANNPNNWWPALANNPEVVAAIDEIGDGVSCPTLPNTQFRVGTGPSIGVDRSQGTFRGRVYVAFDREEAGGGTQDNNIYVRAGDWNAMTGQIDWVSAPVRVNDVTTNDQFFPWIAVNDNGDVGVMWYDRRNDPANTQFDVYFAFSTDGGVSWSENILVTTGMSDPGTGGIFIGDYNGLTAQGNKFYPLWTDLRGSASPDIGDIYTARIAIAMSSPPTLVNVMGGIGAEFPGGSADTFISPHGDWSPKCDFTSFQITATEPVTLVAKRVVFTGNPVDTPDVLSLQDDGGGLHTVILDRPLVPGHWAKITLTVQSNATGCQGTLLMWVAHHPDNVNQDGVTNIMDATAFGNEFNGQARLELVDLNCDNLVNMNDSTAFGHIWNGTGGAGQAWANTSLPAKP